MNCNELAEWDVHPLHDSGNRREFASGAVRDISEGKGRCDLLPLDVVGRLVGGPAVIGNISAYMEDGNTEHIEDAIRSFIYGEELFFDEDYDARIEIAYWMLEVSKHFERGAIKYGDRNAYLGVPTSSFIDSGVRHYLKVLRGDKDEPHEAAFLWNMLMLIWTHHHRPECINIQFKEEEE